jgi:hypothetical protein
MSCFKYTMVCSLIVCTVAWSQLSVKNSGDIEVMHVDDNANVTIGHASQSGTLTIRGDLTTNTITIINGAGNGKVLKSNSTGRASWGTDQVNDADHDTGNELQTLTISKNDNLVSWNLSDNGGSGNFSVSDQFTFLSGLTYLFSSEPMGTSGIEVNLCQDGHVPTDAKMIQVYWGAYTNYSQDQYSRSLLIRGGAEAADNAAAGLRTLDTMVAGNWPVAFEYKSTLIPMPANCRVRVYPETPTAGTSCSPPNCIRADTATLGVIGYIK